MKPLSKKIITTLTYYDVLDYPMTSFEIWKYLVSHNVEREAHNAEKKDISLADIVKELENEEVKKFIEQYRGYYFLRGRENLAEERLEKNKIAEQKFKITRRAVKWLRFIPFVRMLAVTGTLAMKNTQKKSDLDLLIVLKHGHIFTGRILITGLTHLLGVRRYGQKITNRICLNFFITDKSLEIDLKDLFSANEYSFIWPLFDTGVFSEFQKANGWIKNFKENFEVEKVTNVKVFGNSLEIRIIRKIGETLLSFGFIEKRLKDWQTKRITNDPRTHLPGSMIVADDNALIFLPGPQGPKVFEEFQGKISDLRIS